VDSPLPAPSSAETAAETTLAGDSVDHRVRSELLRTAIAEARAGAPALVFTAGVLAWIAWSAGQARAGVAVLALAVALALWRVAMLRAARVGSSPGRIVRSERAFEAHALLSGGMSALAAIFIYPAAEGVNAALVIATFAAMMSVATLFMTLAGRALAYYLAPQLLAMFAVSLFDARVYSPLFALAIPVFYLTLRRAAQRHRRAVELSIRRRIDADAVNAALREAKIKAEAASAAKSQFLANMSHELRTPMTGVLGALQLLARDKLDPKQRELLGIATASSEALLTVLGEVLDFAEIEAGELELVREAVQIRELVESAVKLFVPLAQRRGLALSADIDPSLPVAVWGDAARIRLVLLNFVGNAVKFTEQGGVVVRAFRARPVGADRPAVTIEVADTGIGIAAEALSGLFAPFHQVDSSDRRRFGGTGLGLAISKRLTEAMGGTISVESEPGRGSTFRVSLPLEEALEEAAPAALSR
jgi:signal transduction histidine kinase